MGLVDWLKSLFRPKSVVRNVAELAGTDAATTSEVVDVSGGPLKPNHRRLAITDPRLLPKLKPKVEPYIWPRPKRPKYFSRDEANRLFSDSLRTGNRSHRCLATDEEQLRRYGLPIWMREADVAEALGLTVGMLRHFSIHRKRETTPHYIAFSVRKRGGGQRILHAPKKRLKEIQRKLNAELVSKLPVSPYAQGFLPKRSVATNAQPHVGKEVVVKLDLKDCFPSIHYSRVRGLLISWGYCYTVAATLAVLMTEAPRQRVKVKRKIYHVPVGPRVCVQGAPTSPGICNAVLLRLDHRIAGVAHKYGFTYTRYADDLTLSGDDVSVVPRIISMANRIVSEEGFQLNNEKTRVLRRGRRQRVTGVIVNSQMGLSRVERRRIRAEIHQLDPNEIDRRRRLAGKIAYLNMLNPQQAEPLRQAFEKACQRSDA